MPIDWDKIDKKLDTIIDTAADATDKELASEISSITSLTDDEVQELFPKASDTKKLLELMKIVKSAGDRNNKINNIIQNSEKFGGVILTLLSKLT